MSKEAVDQGLNYLWRCAAAKSLSTQFAPCRTCASRRLDVNGMTMDQIQWLIPHQANLRIIDAVGKHFGIPSERVVVNVHDTGNTSAATVPVAFDEAVRDGRIKRGDNVLLTAFGSGLTSGSLLLKF
jgi:3-oxoacyl-[acyl-carrier-protein] synthase III